MCTSYVHLYSWKILPAVSFNSLYHIYIYLCVYKISKRFLCSMFLFKIIYLWLHRIFIVARGFSSWAQGMWDLSPLTRDQTYMPCFGRQILKHWTTREVLCSYSFLFFNVCLFLSVLGLRFVSAWAFFSFGEDGLLFSCSIWASHCSYFSCWRAWGLGRVGFSSCCT